MKVDDDDDFDLMQVTLQDLDEEDEENEEAGTSRFQISQERTSREVTLFDANSRQFNVEGS